MARHLAALSESARVLSSCTSLGDVPLVVITSGHQPDDSRLEQQRLAAGSSRGRQVVAAGSGHWVHLDDPELVIATIREMVEGLRGGGRYDASKGV
jgi:pimeloyl-ACP methyl ester carboxylesterase